MKNKMKFNLYLIPLILMVFIAPLVVRLVFLEIHPDTYNFYNGNREMFDFYAYWKSRIIILTGIICAITLGIEHLSSNFSFIKKNKSYIFLGIFAFFTIVSAFLSPYRDIALNGYPERFEGLWVYLSYFTIFVYSINFIKSYKDLKTLILFTMGASVIMSIVAFTQFVGNNFLATDLGLNLIVPRELESLKQDISFSFGKGIAYGTLYNPNYLGSYASMLLPITLYPLISKCFSKAEKGLSILALMGCIFMLFSSNSRAGLIGVMISFLAGLIVFRKDFLRVNKKQVTYISLSLIVLIGAFTFFTQDVLKVQVNSLLSDISKIISQNNEFNLREEILLQDIIINNNEIRIETKENTLVIINQNGDIIIKNEDGDDLDLIAENNRFVFQDEKYSNIILERFHYEPASIEFLRYRQNGISLYIGIDNNEIVLMDNKLIPIDLNELYNTESWGFNGLEKIGSSRGYIWSRSFPILKDSVIIGSGPDTFAAVFPQNDLFAKLYAYNSTELLTDKPHNMYIGIGITIGLFGLTAFMCLIYISLRNSLKYKSNILLKLIGLAILGYLGSGIFNDSVVGVAQIFWILLAIPNIESLEGLN